MSLETLFRAVYEAPELDTPRHVLADALQMEGAPRGDFIALQLRDSVISRRRSAKLLIRHRDAFLGELREVVVNPLGAKRAGTVHEQWEKGFLVECTVRLSGTTVDCEAWATVRTLHVFAQPELPGELASPHFGALREVFVYETYQLTDEARTLLDALEARGVRVTRG